MNLNDRSLGWDLPAGTSDNDPLAPWNDRGHCPNCCPAHEDSPQWDDPLCTECDGPVSEGVCYLWALLPAWLACRLKGFKFLWGLMPPYCNPQKEPECHCDDCSCGEPDFEDPREYDYWAKRID